MSGNDMHINADFSRSAIVDRSTTEWQASPAPGVDRIMLDRIGDEVARATSIVRYAAGSAFSRHEHAKGEEFLVLDGVFSDESGDYPAGTYVRNPPGSGHAPFSDQGCRIFVKLRQFDPADLTPVVSGTEDGSLWQAENGPDQLPLHTFGDEKVSMMRFVAGEEYDVTAGRGGMEILLVRGAVIHERTQLPAESWLRFPPGHRIALAMAADTVLWMKQGHLPSGA